MKKSDWNFTQELQKPRLLHCNCDKQRLFSSNGSFKSLSRKSLSRLAESWATSAEDAKSGKPAHPFGQIRAYYASGAR